MSRPAVIMLLFTFPLSAQAPGTREFERCAACHGAPDPRIEGDDLWIGRIATTACVQPPAPRGRRKRLALIAFLRSGRRELPSVVDEARRPRPVEGLVTVPFRSGSVLLVPIPPESERLPVRLVWRTRREGDLARAVPAGTWMVRSFRVQREDPGGSRWQLWGSGPRGRRLQVRPGRTAHLGLDLRVHVAPQARTRGRSLQVGLAITGDSGMGVTVMKGRTRTPATYALEGRGWRLAGGVLGYG